MSVGRDIRVLMGRIGHGRPRRRNDVANEYDPKRIERAKLAARRAAIDADAKRRGSDAIRAAAARREWNRVGKRVAADVFATFGRTCHLCGRPNSATTADHIIPKSEGGAHTVANCRPACAPCNTGRGTRSVDEYRAYLRERGRLYDPNVKPSRDWGLGF